MKSFCVLGVVGRFFEDEIPGTVCFVPNSLVSEGKLDEGQYVLQGWASLNIKTQPVELRIGSHLFPDLTKPCDKQAICARIGRRIAKQRPWFTTGSVPAGLTLVLQSSINPRMNIANLSAEQLRRAAEIKEQIEKLHAELSNLLDGSAPTAGTSGRRGPRKMSAAARAKIAAGQKARWARQKGGSATALKKTRRTMSAAAKAKLSAMAKARWAKARKQGKTTLKGS